MRDDKLLLTIAVAAVAVALIAAGFTYFSIASLTTRISGFATGEANLTVESLASINFTTSSISWGSGRVDSGADAAVLTTLETGNVTSGNWTLVTSGGLRIENIGNSNVSLNLTVGKSAASFLGGTGPGYEWNVSNVESSSCLNSTGGTGNLNLGTWSTTSTTTTNFCGIFQFLTASDSIRIDLNLTVPGDSLTGTLGDIITATVVAI